MTPDFAVWKRETLERFAKEAYDRLRALQQENEQLRHDFRDAMTALRREMAKHDA